MSQLNDVADKWKSVGEALGLPPSVLDEIGADNRHVCKRCLSEMVKEWLNQSHKTEHFGVPSWKMLVWAVAHPNGGNNHALAQKIAAIHTSQLIHSYTIGRFCVLC